jgi:hypothetical protein
MHSPLFKLNEDLLVYIFTEWFDVRSLGVIDIAVTNRLDRRNWLLCLSMMSTMALDDWYHDNSSIKWFSKRKIRLNDIRVSAL